MQSGKIRQVPPIKTKTPKTITKAKKRQICRNAKIYPDLTLDQLSKITKVSKSTVWKVLTQNELNSRLIRERYQAYYKRTTKTIDGAVIERMFVSVAGGTSVSAVCKEFAISRTTYYGIYKQTNGNIRTIRRIYAEKHELPKKHYRTIAEGERIVLELVDENPHFTIREIAKRLKENTGEGSSYYVYTVLKRYNLTKKDKRMAYSVSINNNSTLSDRVLDILRVLQKREYIGYRTLPLNMIATSFAKGVVMPIGLGVVIVSIALPMRYSDSRDYQRNYADHDASQRIAKFLLVKNNSNNFTSQDVPITPQKDLSWGVFAINTTRGISKIGDTNNVEIAVLDDTGMGDCEAELAIEVIDPKGKKQSFGTQDGSMEKAESCGPNSVTDNPDFAFGYKGTRQGKYSIIGQATTSRGTRKTASEFYVSDDQPFEISRQSATRIWPKAMYTMTIRVKANQNYIGTINEQLPSGFTVPENRQYTVQNTEYGSFIQWNVRLKEGEERVLSYQYDTPDVSPELFTFDRLQIVDKSGQELMREYNGWNIAVDGL